MTVEINYRDGYVKIVDGELAAIIAKNIERLTPHYDRTATDVVRQGVTHAMATPFGFEVKVDHGGAE